MRKLTGTLSIAGPPGRDGHGVPQGGLTGLVLTKKSNTDYDTEWRNNDDVSYFSVVNGKLCIVYEEQ